MNTRAIGCNLLKTVLVKYIQHKGTMERYTQQSTINLMQTNNLCIEI